FAEPQIKEAVPWLEDRIRRVGLHERRRRTGCGRTASSEISSQRRGNERVRDTPSRVNWNSREVLELRADLKGPPRQRVRAVHLDLSLAAERLDLLTKHLGDARRIQRKPVRVGRAALVDVGLPCTDAARKEQALTNARGEFSLDPVVFLPPSAKTWILLD